jgi:uncharacterized protein YprB with RNaseH-like and TPR domain
MRTLRRRRWPWQRGSGDDIPLADQDVLAALQTGEPKSLESLVSGSEIVANGQGFYLVRPVGTDVDPDAQEEARQFMGLREWPADVTVGSTVKQRRRKKSKQPELEFAFEPERMVLLDIETAGLSANTYVFLIGMMFLEGNDFVVEQAFARDYEEEAGVLHHVHDTLSRFETVVTYNGASFDLPFIRTRMAVHRIAPLRPLGSVDLLHTARRVFKDILPNRRLVTVEQHLRRKTREGDIPGRLIPQAWHDYVQSGDGRAMEAVLYHNRMDIFTMAVILNRLSERENTGF